MNPILLFIAAGVTALWGIAHLFATKGAVESFGNISADSRRILTMEWIAEGVALISMAAFVAVAAGIDPLAPVSSAVFAVAIGTLVTLAIVSLSTGFRVSFLPYKLCPAIFMCCLAKGMPMMVMAHRMAKTKWVSAIQMPPNTIQRMFMNVDKQPAGRSR